MGFRFNPNDFPFATTLNGLPIACRYSRVVKEAIDDVEKKIGRGLGDSDDDGKWDIICKVDGTTGRLMQRKQLESDVKTDSGEKVGTLKGEYSDPVDAPIVTIIAAHCGPLAVAAESASSSDTVAVTSAGTVVHNGHSSFLGWVWRFLVLIIGLVAAAAALLKANFAPLTSVPQVGQVQSQVGSNNLGLIGIVCAVFGVIFLLWGLIIFGLLVNLSIIAAGLYAGLDVLVGAGAVKPEAAAKIRPLGVPIGLACAVLVVLELFIAGRLYIL